MLFFNVFFEVGESVLLLLFPQTHTLNQSQVGETHAYKFGAEGFLDGDQIFFFCAFGQFLLEFLNLDTEAIVLLICLLPHFLQLLTQTVHLLNRLYHIAFEKTNVLLICRLERTLNF